MLAHSFGGFSLQLIGPLAFGPVVRLPIKAKVCGEAKAAPCDQGLKRKRKGIGSYSPLLGMNSMTCKTSH
jgi:hypothetical protein